MSATFRSSFAIVLLTMLGMRSVLISLALPSSPLRESYEISYEPNEIQEQEFQADDQYNSEYIEEVMNNMTITDDDAGSSEHIAQSSNLGSEVTADSHLGQSEIQDEEVASQENRRRRPHYTDEERRERIRMHHRMVLEARERGLPYQTFRRERVRRVRRPDRAAIDGPAAAAASPPPRTLRERLGGKSHRVAQLPLPRPDQPWK